MKCAQGMRKSEADGRDLSGMNVFQFFLFTMFLLCYCHIFNIFLLYSNFLSRFFNENLILLVVDNL